MDNEESVLTIDKYGIKRWKDKKSGYMLHRIEGPAIDCGNGHIYWYLRGRSYSSKEEFFNALTEE